MTTAPSLPVLNADDYAMTAGVSDAIEQLARARRLSATSVMTNMPDWPARAPRLRDLRSEIATGLHLNLTVGRALTPSSDLAPSGMFSPLNPLIVRAVTRRLDTSVLRDEIRHQLDLFEEHLGFPPDHVDGHQHVQILPVVRSVLLAELTSRYRTRPPLFRLPANADGSLASTLSSGIKASIVAGLGTGAAAAVAGARLPRNRRFSGFSSFDLKADYATEIDRELKSAAPAAGEISIVMCHPGFPDETLARIDPITTRRRQEFDALMALPGLPDRIWHPSRTATAGAQDWSR